MTDYTVPPGRTFHPLDTIPRSAMLGLRFLDQAFEARVTGGLQVSARPVRGNFGPVPAALNGDGIYVFNQVPGMSATGDVIIEVWDKLGRYLPMATVVTLPAPQTPKDYYLFSAPIRPASPGLGAIRGLLVDRTRSQPAAYAVLEAEHAGQKWYGVADERGTVVVNFPYPNFVKSASDPPSSQKLLINQGWSFTVRAHYRPAALLALPGATVPDLRTILGQAICSMTTKQAPLTNVTQFDVTVQFGQEFVVRTDSLPHLLLTPSTSPP